MPRVCSACGYREAFYYRSSSGESLCPACLYGSLERRIKRGLSGIVRPGVTVAAILTPIAPLESLGLLVVMARLESRYGSRVIAVAREGFEGYLKAAGLVGWFTVRIQPRPSASTPRHHVSLDLLTAKEAVSSGYADIAVLPYTRDLLNALLLDSLSNGDLEGVALSDPRHYPSHASLPASMIEAEALAAIAVRQGGEAWGSAPWGGASASVKAALDGGPELVFSARRTGSLLAEQALRALGGRCRVCGSPASGSLCDACRYLGLESARLAFSPSRGTPGSTSPS